MPISGKEMCKFFRKAGYEIIPGGGKGSHFKLKKKGNPTVIIPNHKELVYCSPLRDGTFLRSFLNC